MEWDEYRKREVLKFIKEFYKRKGKTPTAIDIQRGGFSPRLIYRLFPKGKIKEALRSAGVPIVEERFAKRNRMKR